MDERNIMKRILCNSIGNDFQKVFSDIMAIRKENFIRITSYGNIGDKKNDGYLMGSGIFFQVYGPEENNISTQKNAIIKMKKDFKELIKNCREKKVWEDIKKCIFVYNDKARGITSPLIEGAKFIEKEFKIEVKIWGIDDILREFDLLKPEYKKYVITENNFILKECDDFYYRLNDKNRMDIFFKHFKNFVDYLKQREIMFGQGIPVNILYPPQYCNEKDSLEKLLIKWEGFDSTFFSDRSLENMYRSFKNNFLRLMEILRNYYYLEEDFTLTCYYFDESQPIFQEISQLVENENFYNSHQIYMERVKEVQNIYKFLVETGDKLIEEKKRLEFNW